MVIRAICAGFVIGALACTFQPAHARNIQLAAVKLEPKRVTRVKVGVRVEDPAFRSPRLGPQIVYHGGYTPLDEMLRPRFIGGMIDLYPTERSGIRLSVGTRYFARPNFWIAAEQATGGLLYDPHMRPDADKRMTCGDGTPAMVPVRMRTMTSCTIVTA